MPRESIPPLPGVDPATALSPGDPGDDAWLESVAFSPAGVDRALVWESLQATPRERLARLQSLVDRVLAARGRRPEIR
ncbi:MAG: hypothetical protein IPJ17_16965 [Holophagales bacterium]|nr:MAG: hypothetical protein IPJ17_16965 [Holophagales bacterium]